MPTVKENVTVKNAKEIIALQTDIIVIDAMLSKVKHADTIRGLNDIKSSITNRTFELANSNVEAQGGNE